MCTYMQIIILHWAVTALFLPQRILNISISIRKKTEPGKSIKIDPLYLIFHISCLNVKCKDFYEKNQYTVIKYRLTVTFNNDTK